MIESLRHSFMFAWSSLTSFVAEQPFLFVIIALLVLWSIISHFIKSALKKKYIDPYERSKNTQNKQFYIEYYRRSQYVNVFGVALVVILFFTYLLTKDKIVGTVLAVGIGAILITFQTFTVSFFTYFILVRNYNVGDTVSVGAGKYQGEILYIKSLYMGVSGKNDFGENTGEFYIIPNHQIWTNPVVKVDLSLDNVTKHSLTLVYDGTNFLLPFDEFIQELEAFLLGLMPIKAASQVSYFKSYIGVRYKIDFTYDKDGKPCVWIGFVAKRSEGVRIKKAILSFVEAKKISGSSIVG
ncbi:MAG: hypothetical protein ACFN4U_00505 [Candidatus Absconditicoccaceae bacterium]